MAQHQLPPVVVRHRGWQEALGPYPLQENKAPKRAPRAPLRESRARAQTVKTRYRSAVGGDQRGYSIEVTECLARDQTSET